MVKSEQLPQRFALVALDGLPKKATPLGVLDGDFHWRHYLLRSTPTWLPPLKPETVNMRGTRTSLSLRFTRRAIPPNPFAPGFQFGSSVPGEMSRSGEAFRRFGDRTLGSCPNAREQCGFACSGSMSPANRHYDAWI